jgi:phosphatidylserine/phosphatidylglycerophosphate/cardiolipin synthase-like enzyme
MPFRQSPSTHTPYSIIAFDKGGVERKDDHDGTNGLMSKRVLTELVQNAPTDVFVFSHGWRGDVAAAIDQYNRWIDAMANLAADAARMGSLFRPMWIGLHWPSEPWGDEELGAGGAFAADASAPPPPAPANLLETYLDRLDLTQSLRARELMGIIFRENRVNAGAAVLPQSVADAYTELATLLGYESGPAGSDPGSDNSEYSAQAAFDAMNSTGVAFGGGSLGGLLGPLRQLSFWMMKKRARTVGEGGMHQFVAQLQQSAPNTRVHLMGHSFGCIVVSSICNGPNGVTALPRPIDSLALVQGAVSHWAYADAIPATGGRGYFNTMIRRPGVKGPIVTTRSVHDTAVGVFYPAAVSLALQDPSFVINPALIRWGAIGAFGIQGLSAAIDGVMQPETADYHFEAGKVYNLEASKFVKKMQGPSGAHCDIDGPQVAHAIWQAAFAGLTATPSFVPAEVVVVQGAGANTGRASTALVPATPLPVPAAPNIVLPKLTPPTEAEMPIPFGVQAETGQYLPPIQESDLDHIQKASQLAEIRAANANASHLAAIADVAPDNLEQTGWGVIFASATPSADKQAIKDALKPLLDLRASQAGDLFKVFDDVSGYQQGVTADQWLSARGSALNVVDPTQGVPYYLLIVGSPTEIPFEFQYDLDTYFAVGRLSFESPKEYAQYAQNIVNFEKGGGQQKTIAIFNTRNDGDRATALLHDQVAIKLANGDGSLKPLGGPQGYSLTTRLADTATKPELLKILRGEGEGGTPAILFTGSHGVAFSMADPQQRVKQGALLTQDWAGPGSPITPETYFTAAEVPSNIALNGLLHFFFACYSGGCPKLDTYSYGPGNQPVQIAKETLISRLPQQLLLQGAQAVIGHIDRAWAYSFQTNTGQAMVQSFRDPLVRLLQGRRVGDALDVFDQRWSVLSAGLLTLVQNREVMPNSVPASVMANRWVARDDARNYIVLGDPAARLKIANAPATAPGAGAASFGVAAAGPAPVMVEEAPAVAFEAHLDAKPILNFRDFTGVIAMKAAVSPDCSYQLVQGALAQAGDGSKVDVYIYSISAPHLVALLKGAVDRGAEIRVMYDPAQMAAADAQKLRSFGIDVRVAPSHDPRRVFTTCHQKFVVVDRKLVVLESANWANTSIPLRNAGEERKKGNREWMVRIDDENVADWYATLFDADWDIPSLGEAFAAAVAEAPLEALSVRAPRFAAPRDFPMTNFAGRSMTVSPLTSPDNYFDTLLPLLRSARKRIWVQQQYIEGAAGPAVPRLLDAISQKQRSGVDVRFIVSSRFNESWVATKETMHDAKLFNRLRAINLDNFTHCHNKGVIVDDAVIVSSTNWSENSIRRAREAGILIHSADVAGFFGQVFDDDWKTGWSVSTADSQATSFEAVAVPGGEDLTIDPADRV